MTSFDFTLRVLVFGWLGFGLSLSALPRQADSSKGTNAQEQRSEKKLDFNPIIMGEAIRDGIHFGFTDFKASDGESLHIMYTSFSDAPEAREYFDKQLTKAAKISARSDKLNSAGENVGERAEIVLSVGSYKGPSVLWTDGRTFHQIYSLSLADSLELERVYKY